MNLECILSKMLHVRTMEDLSASMEDFNSPMVDFNSPMVDFNSPTTSSAVRSRKRAMTSQDGPRLTNFCTDHWTWNKKDKSKEVLLYGHNFKIAQFHPNWSNGTAGVRGTKILNKGRYYWEVHVTQRIFGTSMMFGIGTKKANLHKTTFVNMLGEDEYGWGLSHKGLLWHDGKWRQYSKPFRENESVTVGVFFDGIKGTLSYYKDGCDLGVAFTDLHLVQDDLFPAVCSTAAKTEMCLGVTMREFSNLQDRCRASILKLLREVGDVSELCLPNLLKLYLKEGLEGMPKTGRSKKDARKRGLAAAMSRRNYFMRSSSCGPHRLSSLKNYSYMEENCKYYL